MKQQELIEAARKTIEGYKGLNQNKELDSNFIKLLKEPVLNLIEQKVGQYEIKIDIIPAGEEMTVVSARNWLLMGYKQLKVSYKSPRPLFKLLKNGTQLLMSDSPQEMFLQYDAYKEAKGKVLVGGLGLGLYANMVAKKSEVTEVVVIEIDKDVIKLSKPKNKKIRIINSDIKKFLEETKESFDYIYIDTYYGTSCMEYIHTVLPLKEILEKRFSKIPASFWGEEEMKSQYDPDFDKKGGM